MLYPFIDITPIDPIYSAGAILDIEIGAYGTRFSAPSGVKAAFATYFDGSSWMIYRNVLKGGVLHWDFSALGRFISFPVIDNQ